MASRKLFPEALESLSSLLQDRAKHEGSKLAFTILGDGELTTASLTYQGLHDRASRIAGRLQISAEIGDRALILMQSSLDFVSAFFGCVYAGVVAVPAYPPRANRNLHRLQAIIDDCEANVVLTTEGVLQIMNSWISEHPKLKKMKWISVDSLDASMAENYLVPKLASNQLAFLQYTSGSTGSPKGVMLTHGNLIANLKMIQSSFGFEEQSVMVSWLPMFHDMGLIGCVLEPIYAGCHSVIMPPTAFLERPRVWLKAISNYRGTIAGAPNFAFELCVKKYKQEDFEGVNLSSLRVLFNGAEPVRAQTLRKFVEIFAKYGLSEKTLMPCYGLAEATLLVSSSKLGSGPATLHSDKKGLAEGHYVSNSTEEDAIELVSSGDLAELCKVVIVDPETRKTKPKGTIGEIWIQGPHIAQGYWKKEELSLAQFRATIEGSLSGKWLRTGDLGFVDKSELVVSGRLKDLIIIAGRNYYPQDLEAAAELADKRIRSGGVACFSFEHQGKEMIGLIAEVERTAIKSDLTELASVVTTSIWNECDTPVQMVAFIKPGAIPKTSSGKIQRQTTKREWTSGSLEILHSWQSSGVELRESVKVSLAIQADADVDTALVTESEIKSPKLTKTDMVPLNSTVASSIIPNMPPKKVVENVEITETIIAQLKPWLAGVLEVEEASIRLDQSLPSLGIDSIVVVEMYKFLESTFSIRVPNDLAWEAANLGALVKRVAELCAHKNSEMQSTGARIA